MYIAYCKNVTKECPCDVLVEIRFYMGDRTSTVSFYDTDEHEVNPLKFAKSIDVSLEKGELYRFEKGMMFIGISYMYIQSVIEVHEMNYTSILKEVFSSVMNYKNIRSVMYRQCSMMFRDDDVFVYQYNCFKLTQLILGANMFDGRVPVLCTIGSSNIINDVVNIDELACDSEGTLPPAPNVDIGLSNEVIEPYYRRAFERAVACIKLPAIREFVASMHVTDKSKQWTELKRMAKRTNSVSLFDLNFNLNWQSA